MSTAVPPVDLAGSVAVVTGAGDGIGAAIAQALCAHGATVVFAGRDQAKLESSVETVAETSGRGFAAHVDVSDVASIRALAADTVARHGGVSILVNSAGASTTKSAFEVAEDDWDLVHDVALRGTFFACQAFGRPMADAGYGKIVNLGSTWGATVGVNRSTYCAATAGVHHLTAALAAEWAPLGVRVNSIAPTTTRTPRVERLYASDPEREKYAVERIPLGRIAEPDDVTGAALFLAGPTSDFITGDTLFVDGGWRLAK